MSDSLKNWIDNHRDAFDSEEPSKDLWQKIDQQIERSNDNPVLSIRNGLWSVAVAATLLVAVSVLSFYRNQTKDGQRVQASVHNAGTPGMSASVDSGNTGTADTDSNGSHAQGDPQAGTQTVPQTQQVQTGGDSLYTQELYHFTQIINIKFREIEKIKSAHPELYQRFTADIEKLDSNYQQLKQQLPGEANQELLLKAMLQNLTLQIDLINRQLGIIEDLKNESHAKTNNTTSI